MPHNSQAIRLPRCTCSFLVSSFCNFQVIFFPHWQINFFSVIPILGDPGADSWVMSEPRPVPKPLSVIGHKNIFMPIHCTEMSSGALCGVALVCRGWSDRQRCVLNTIGQFIDINNIMPCLCFCAQSQTSHIGRILLMPFIWNVSSNKTMKLLMVHGRCSF